MLGFIRDRRRLNDRLGLDDRLRLNHGSNSLNLRSTPCIRLHRLSLRSTPRIRLHGLILRSTPRIRLHGLRFHSGLNDSSRLGLNDGLGFNDRSNSLNLGSTPHIRLHGLSFHSGLNDSSRLGLNDGLGFNDRSNSLNLGGTPRVGPHGLSLRSTPRIRLNGLGLRSTPRIRLNGLSLYSGLNNSGRLFNNRLSLLHHGSNSLHNRRGLNRRSFLRNGRRLGSGLLHGRGSLTVGIDRLRRSGDGSRLRDGRMSGNNTPVCQPLGKRRIQRRVRRHVGVQIRASGGDIGEVLRCQRRIAHVSSGELRQIKSAHLYSSRTRRRSS